MTTYEQVVKDLGSWLEPRELRDQTVQEVCAALVRRGIRLDADAGRKRALRQVQRGFAHVLSTWRWKLYHLRQEADSSTDVVQALERHVRDVEAIAKTDRNHSWFARLSTHP